MITAGLKMMFNSASPFYVKPSLDANFLKWALAFKRSATKEKVEKAIPAIKDINLLSKELYSEIYNEPNFNFQLENKGILMFYQTDKVGEKESKVTQRAIEEGLEVDFLSPTDVKQLEPNVDLYIINVMLTLRQVNL